MMARVLQLLYLLIALGAISEINGQNDQYSYSEQTQWPGTCNVGKSQSPININTWKLSTKNYFEDIRFDSNYRGGQNATIENDGHLVKIVLTNEATKPTISRGGLGSEYALQEFHFHWTSEHKIDNTPFPLEGHFVHFARKYSTPQNYSDGVAVLAVLYKISDVPNPAFEPLVANVPRIAKTPGQPVPLDYNVAPYNFLPENTHCWYRYNGSLTTPPCSEVVVWTVFQKFSYISRSQYKRLTTIYGYDQQPIQRNNRDTQPLNGRTVFVKYK